MRLSDERQQQLRALVAAGDPEAQRAIGLWMQMQKEKHGSTRRRLLRRATERTALRALRAAREREVREQRRKANEAKRKAQHG